MFKEIIGAFVDKEEETNKVITSALERYANELNVKHDELLITIAAKNNSFEPRFLLYKIAENEQKVKTKYYVKDITIKEILNEKKE